MARPCTRSLDGIIGVTASLVCLLDHTARGASGEKSRRFGTVEIARGHTIPHVEHWEQRLSDIGQIGRRAVCAHCCAVHIKPKRLGWRCGVAERKGSATGSGSQRPKNGHTAGTSKTGVPVAASSRRISATQTRITWTVTPATATAVTLPRYAPAATAS